MADDARKKKRRFKSNKILVGTIVIYFLFRFVPTIFSQANNTILPKDEVWADRYEAYGIAIKNEKVLDLNLDENVKMLVEEGARVGVGTKIAELDDRSYQGQLKKELEEIDEQIQLLSRIEGENTDSGKVEDKGQENEQTKALIEEDSLAGSSLEALKERRKIIVNNIRQGRKTYTAPISGIISFNVDGYEDVFLPREFENYSYENLRFDEIEGSIYENGKDVKGNRLKLVDNFQWYIALGVEDTNDFGIESIGGYLDIELIDYGTRLRGQVVTINRSHNQAVIILELDSLLHEMYDLRFFKANIIKTETQALKIPSKSIVEEDGQAGVYVKDFSGLVRFRPIYVLGTSDEYTFVKKGDHNGYIMKGEDKIRTISLYDEILLNPLKQKIEAFLD